MNESPLCYAWFILNTQKDATVAKKEIHFGQDKKSLFIIHVAFH